MNYSDDLDKVSIDQDLNFVDASGKQDNVIENGMLTVLEHLNRDFPLDEVLQLDSIVRQINWEVECADGIRSTIELEDGRVIAARHVIVTVPLGVLKSNSICFVPDLPPRKQEAIRNLGFGCLNKIYLFFERAWWKKNTRANALFVETIPEEIDINRSLYDVSNNTWYRSMVTFNDVYGHDLALEALIGGKWAHVVENIPADEILNVADQILKRSFGNDYDVETPSKVVRTSWCQDPFTQGGVTYIAMDSHLNDLLELASPIPMESPRLFFAGEATSSTQWASVHGAMDTGIKVADMVAQAMLYKRRGDLSPQF